MFGDEAQAMMTLAVAYLSLVDFQRGHELGAPELKIECVVPQHDASAYIEIGGFRFRRPQAFRSRSLASTGFSNCQWR